MRDLEIHSILSLNFSVEETEAREIRRSAGNTQTGLRCVCGLKPSGQGTLPLFPCLSPSMRSRYGRVIFVDRIEAITTKRKEMVVSILSEATDSLMCSRPGKIFQLQVK